MSPSRLEPFSLNPLEYRIMVGESSLCTLRPGPHAACNPTQLRRFQKPARGAFAAPASLRMKAAEAAEPEIKWHDRIQPHVPHRCSHVEILWQKNQKKAPG